MPSADSPATISSVMAKLLTDAVSAMDDQARYDILSYVQSRHNSDGGYQGRDEKSDLYYTLFALLLLDALKQPDTSKSLRFYLNSLPYDSLGLVDRVCLLRCLLRADPSSSTIPILLQGVETYRSADGGYNTAPDCAWTNSYSPFVVLLAYEEAGEIPADFTDAVKAVTRMQLPDGGFVNEDSVSMGSAPATAAAMILESRFLKTTNTAGEDFLKSLYDPCGGFKALHEAPCADLLSTATSICALKFCDCRISLMREKCLNFVEQLWHNGGFGAYINDSSTDCEYTFYGLLALGGLLL